MCWSWLAMAYMSQCFTHFSNSMFIQWLHIASLKSAIGGIFMTQKSASTANQGSLRPSCSSPTLHNLKCSKITTNWCSSEKTTKVTTCKALREKAWWGSSGGIPKQKPWGCHLTSHVTKEVRTESMVSQGRRSSCTTWPVASSKQVTVVPFRALLLQCLHENPRWTHIFQNVYPWCIPPA